MDYRLPNQFDLIIIGTGMVESVVSAAASRIGKSVLHIDNNDYYGGLWASFSLDAVQKIDLHKQVSDIEDSLLLDGENFIHLGNDLFPVKNFSLKWHIPEKCEEKLDNKVNEKNKSDESGLENCQQREDWTKEGLLKYSRKFNIDIVPKLQFARGDFVELLISSNIARYSEFRSVSRVLTWLNGQLEVVPCSRSDVFANNKVSVIEKRMLMKLLTSLDTVETELEAYENKTFHQFLKEKKLTPSLIHYVLYALSMSTDDTTCLEGIQHTKRFLNSLGRFGKTPFLCSMYGSGEIPQQFCRLSAVFGGVYALNQPLNGLVMDNERNLTCLVSNQHRIKAHHFIIGIENTPPSFIKSQPKEYIARAVFITDRSVMESEKEHLTLLLYPPENGRNPVTIIEMGTLTGVCPKDLYLVHMITRQQNNPQEDFKRCKENLFGADADCDNARDTTKPRILWSCFFSIPDSTGLNLHSEEVPKNAFICPGPDIDLDYDQVIEKARDMFTTIYPNAEFLPRAPDPEEIVIESWDPNEHLESFVEKDETNEATVKTFEQPTIVIPIPERGDEANGKNDLDSTGDTIEAESGEK